VTKGHLSENPTEHEWLRGSLSRNVENRLIYSGGMEPKENKKLITLLKSQRAVLLDDDNEEDPFTYSNFTIAHVYKTKTGSSLYPFDLSARPAHDLLT
jgi:hypothetical protein